MARGPYYTEDEDKRLTALRKDFPDAKYTEVAQKAIDYGICDRPRDGIAAHLSALEHPPKKEKKYEEAEQIEFDAEKETLRHDLDTYKKKYEDLINMMFSTATLYHGTFFDGLTFSLVNITKWMKQNESYKFNSRIEELQLTEDTAN